MDAEQTPAYIGRCRGCNQVIGATVDENEQKRWQDIASFMVEMVTHGYIIERTTVEEARKLFGTCTCN